MLSARAYVYVVEILKRNSVYKVEGSEGEKGACSDKDGTQSYYEDVYKVYAIFYILWVNFSIVLNFSPSSPFFFFDNISVCLAFLFLIGCHRKYC